MIRVVGVRFRKAGKVYFFDPAELSLVVGQNVVVETVRGTELGEVAVGARLVDEEEVPQPIKRVVRIATEQDTKQAQDNRVLERDAIGYAQERIHSLGLEMKLVGVEYTFDRSKLLFHFTADKRIDFRELVKDLASRFHTRIELRQIGVRDEAKMLGGLGVCGQGLCCATWIGDFAPVSIKHAKEQDLSMNPNKISGLCGRLKCCLRYEAEAYADAHRRQPKMGCAVCSGNQEARVVGVDLLRENVVLQVADGPRVKVTWEEFASGHISVPEEEQDNGGARSKPQPRPVGGESKPESAPQTREPRRRPSKKRSSAKRSAPAQAPSSAPASQEVAAGAENTSKPPRKRRRNRRRRPKTDAQRAELGDRGGAAEQ